MANTVKKVNTVAIADIKNINTITDTNLKKLNTLEFSSGTPYKVATGGTVTTSGDYKTHTFTSSGTFAVTSAGLTDNTIQYLIIGGGGNGGTAPGFTASLGGGGGGGSLHTSGSLAVPGGEN